MAYNRISSRVAGLDRDTNAFNGEAGPVHSSEIVAELTYKAQILPGLILQPDIQHVWRPGGNAPHPDMPSKPIENTWVLGVRSVVNF